MFFIAALFKENGQKGGEGFEEREKELSSDFNNSWAL
jgi:hypothetical protein